jgi:hypothetical protein
MCVFIAVPSEVIADSLAFERAGGHSQSRFIPSLRSVRIGSNVGTASMSIGG